jgi:hypothetical protein
MKATFFPPKSTVDALSRNRDLLGTDWHINEVVIVSGVPTAEATKPSTTTTPTTTTTTTTTTATVKTGLKFFY